MDFGEPCILIGWKRALLFLIWHHVLSLVGEPIWTNLDSSEHKESISKNTFFNVTMLLYNIWFNVQVFEMVGLFYIGNRIYLPLSKFLNFLWVRKGKEKFGGWKNFQSHWIYWTRHYVHGALWAPHKLFASCLRTN